MARRAATVPPEFGVNRDPLNDAVLEDRENTADRLSEALAELGNFDQGSIKGILYRIPVPNGKFEWIRDCIPPFDISEIMRGLKEEIGGGDYALRIMAENRVRKTIHFSIMKDKAPLVSDRQFAGAQNNDMYMFMQMMMEQNRQAMQQQQADRANQTQLMIGLATVVAPLVLGGKDKTSELITALAAMQPKPVEGNSVKDTLELLSNAKTLFKNDDPSPSFDADDIVGSGLKFAGPLLGSLGKAFSARRQDAGSAPTMTEENPAREPLVFAPPQPRQNILEAPATRGGRFPLIDLIRDDVLYFYSRNHDPEKAADIVFDTLENANVSEAQINELVSAFAISPDWLGELAGEGLDLRSRPEWAEEFISALVTIYSEEQLPGSAGGDANNQRRGEGSPADARNHGGSGAGGVATDGDTKPSGQPDDAGVSNG